MKRSIKMFLALLSAGLLTAAWPTWGKAPLIFVGFIPLLLLEDRIAQGEKGKLFWLSFLCFFVWNTATTWWVWNATPAAVLAWILNGLFMAIVFNAFHLTKKQVCNRPWGNFFLIPYWMAFELLTYHWAAKWPWLNLGNVFSMQIEWIQWYEYTGVAGGTLWVLLVNIFITNVILTAKQKETKHTFINIGATVLLLVVPIVISKGVYKNYMDQGIDTEVIVVQQNCDPWNEQFDNKFYDQVIQNNINLSLPLVTPKTRFVVSSESAIQEGIWLHPNTYDYQRKKIHEELIKDSILYTKYHAFMSYHPEEAKKQIDIKTLKILQEETWLHIHDSVNALLKIQTYLKKHPQMVFVIGGTTYEWVPENMKNDFPAREKIIYNTLHYEYCHNSALIIDTIGFQHRNKSQLTPGVEAIPEWMGFLKNYSITMGIARGTLKTDPESKVMTFDGHKVAVPICYESAFGEYVSTFCKKGADLIFVITNDGWWGHTPGYRQHFEFSKLRAIENRRCVARSANTGRSGFINQRGDVLRQTHYWVPDAIRETLKANSKITFYAKHGDYLSHVAVYLTFVLLITCGAMSLIKWNRSGGKSVKKATNKTSSKKTTKAKKK